MAPNGGTDFRTVLRAELEDKGIQESELAEWLGTSISTVSRRLTGKSELRREEVAILDERLGEHGGLPIAAGFLPDRGELAPSQYFDEQAFRDRFEEVLLLGMSPHASLNMVERSIKRLLTCLRSVKQDRTVRRYRLRLELELLERSSNRSGVTQDILRRVMSLRSAVGTLDDRMLSYEYESILSDLYVGVDDYERALLHQRRALELVAATPSQDAERIRSEITIARLLAGIDPWSPEAAQLLEAAAPRLWVERYEPWRWPRPMDGPSYLDVLHAQFALQLSQADMQQAGDTVSTILDRFVTSPRVSDTITSLLCAAEFYGRDHQLVMMEQHLTEAETLIHQFEQHWFGDEPRLIRNLLRETAG
jgi:hypothetical protein